MDAAFFVLAGSLVVGFVGGLVAGLGLRMASARRAARLEWAVGDLQERLSSLQNKGKAKSRWDKAEQQDIELAQVMQSATPVRKRYDNDPLGDL